MARFPERPWSRRLARALRARMTPEEALLWVVLRDDFRHRFRRQEPLGRYIADFVCYEARVVVEVDGSQHGTEYDRRRDAYLESLGFRVLRFSNLQVRRTFRT